MPGMRWCRYTIEPIGTSLRNTVPESGITADMVVPIAPNTAHARGYEPVHPSSLFPFPNCYHWIDNDVVVRIRVPPCGGFEHDGAIRLSVKERSALIRKFEGDYDRIGDFVHHSQLRSCQVCAGSSSRMFRSRNPCSAQKNLTLRTSQTPSLEVALHKSCPKPTAVTPRKRL